MFNHRRGFLLIVSIAWLAIFQVVNGCYLEIKPPLIVLGYAPVDLAVNFNRGDTIKFKCDSTNNITYNLTGPPKIQCDVNNQWSSKPPKCKATLCSPFPPSIPNAQLLYKVIPGKTNVIGARITYQCAYGFSSPMLSKVCQKNGYWEGNVNCSEITCPRPMLSNGQVFYNSLNYGGIAKYSCKKGYVLIGPSNRTCTIDGTWSVSIDPKCSMLCHEIVAPLNGYFTPAKPSYQPGETIKFKCLTDRYAIKGSETRTCQPDGQWSGSSTKCVVNRCENIGTFGKGNIVFSREQPYIIGTIAKFSCFTGYKLVGADTRYCQKDGMWSNGRNPKCTALSCGEPGHIINGNHNPISENGKYAYGMTVEYKCSSQYYLWGNATIKCTDFNLNPFWTRGPPECLTLTEFSKRCHNINRHFYVQNGHPTCLYQASPHVSVDTVHSDRKLDTLTIVTASAGSTLGALVILLSIMIFVRRFHRSRRFRHHNIRSRFYSDDDHVTFLSCPRGFHFSLPSYDEAMSQVQRDPPPFDAVVPDNVTTVINNNINITLPSDENAASHNSNTRGNGNDTSAHGPSALQISSDQQVNILNNPLTNGSQFREESSGGDSGLDCNSTTVEVGNLTRNSISSQESLTLSELPSVSISEDEQSVNELHPLIG